MLYQVTILKLLASKKIKIKALIKLKKSLITLGTMLNLEIN
jgi:hypothetical protein